MFSNMFPLVDKLFISIILSPVFSPGNSFLATILPAVFFLKVCVLIISVRSIPGRKMMCAPLALKSSFRGTVIGSLFSDVIQFFSLNAR